MSTSDGGRSEMPAEEPSPASPEGMSSAYPEARSAKRLVYWQRRARDAEWRIHWSEERIEATERWAREALDEQRWLAERMTYLYGLAATLGASPDQLAGGMLVRLPQMTAEDQHQLRKEIEALVASKAIDPPLPVIPGKRVWIINGESGDPVGEFFSYEDGTYSLDPDSPPPPTIGDATFIMVTEERAVEMKRDARVVT